jgi:hypothetical protein
MVDTIEYSATSLSQPSIENILNVTYNWDLFLKLYYHSNQSLTQIVSINIQLIFIIIWINPSNDHYLHVQNVIICGSNRPLTNPTNQNSLHNVSVRRTFLEIAYRQTTTDKRRRARIIQRRKISLITSY